MEKYKGEDGGIDVCKGIKDLIADSREEGVSIGVESERRNIIINMLKKNKTMEDICDAIGCDREYVETIKKKM